MNSIPYKHYLDLLAQKPTSLAQKIAVSFLTIVVLFVGIFLVIFYQYAKEAPQRTKYQYLEGVSVDFFQTRESLKEVLSGFKVAGAKVQFVDVRQEETKSDTAFYVALDDLEKTISKIESAKSNINAKKTHLVQKTIPPVFSNLQSDIIDFYESSNSILSKIQNDHLFAKQLLLASSPKLYLPKLTDDEIWERNDKEEIIAYYKSQKESSNTALANLAKLSPPPGFQAYYEAQIAYLTILANLSDNVINTLSVADETDREKATQIEKSYQLLTGAKRENEAIEKKLLEEKLKIVDVKENLNQLASIEMRANSLSETIKSAHDSTPEPQAPNPIAPLKTLWTNSQEFLQGLQIPTII